MANKVEEIIPKAILLDLGGVVVSNAPRMFIREFAVKHNLSLEEVVNAFKMHFGNWLVGKVTEEKFWGGFLNELNLPIAEDAFIADSKEMLRLFIVVDEDLLGVLKTAKLNDKGLKLAVLSNCPKEIAEYIEKKYEISTVFDKTFYSGNLGMSKPDTAMFEHAAKELGLAVEQCTFVDDRERNITPAEELGMNVIKFESLDKLKEELQEEKNNE